MIRSNITWLDEHASDLKGKILVTLSMEGCVPELRGDAREANTRGGLGIYFGDKLEGLVLLDQTNHHLAIDAIFRTAERY